MGSMITLTRPDGGSLDAYASGLDADRPSVIVIQEWWGLNDHIKSIVDRVASEGYNAVAPDLFHGRVTKDADEASHLMNGLDFPGAVHEDIAAVLAKLRSVNPFVAVMGFCMGGALAIASAVRLDGLTAAVCFYGMPPKSFADPVNIKVPFQGHFGTKDDWVSPAVVSDMEAAMKKAGATPEIYSYDADHAFFNKTRPEVYNPEAAELAWSRTMTFLKAKL